MLRYQSHVCIPKVGVLMPRILKEDHNVSYFIHSGATKMNCVLREVFWWKGIKRNIEDYVAKCPNFQQIKVLH